MSKSADDLNEEFTQAFAECTGEFISEDQNWKTRDCNIAGDEVRVQLEIEAAPVHRLFYRLQKCLGKKLGREYHLGIKDAMIDRLEIRFELETEPLTELSMPFAEKLEFDDKKCTVILGNVDNNFIIGGAVERLMRRIEERVEKQYYEGKEEFWELMEESSYREPKWEKDPSSEMVDREWIVKGPTKGKWFYRPEITAILNAMKEIAKKEILEPMGFQEVIESNFVPFDVWRRTGHMMGVPNEVYYFSEPATRDPAFWQEFQDKVYITNEVDIDELRKLVSDPKGGIVYAQCPNIYWSFEKAVIPEEDLPLKIFENTVASARYESGGRHGIERSDEFHRIEIVYIGTPEQLNELKEELIERFHHVFDDILEINWRMAWVTPWYMQQSGQDGVEDETEHILGTIDFEAFLPYRGDNSDNDSWLEFQNLTIAGDKFTDAFTIKTQ
ncbi:MAG: aminoacyl--tRNA ligase-related protein, partial [Promethearchaeati archaeon]